MNDMPDCDVIEAMRRYGGGFMQSLAEAANRADPSNLAKIKIAFSGYWAEYSDIARASKGSAR